MILPEQPGGDERRRATGEDRRQLVAEGRAAVADAARERLGDERRLRAIHHVVRQQRQRDGEKHQRRRARVEQAEIDEAVEAGDRRADHVDALPSDAIRQVAGQRDGRERQHRGRQQRFEQKIPRQVQRRSTPWPPRLPSWILWSLGSLRVMEAQGGPEPSLHVLSD